MGILGKIAERVPVRCRDFDEFARRTAGLGTDFEFEANGYIKQDSSARDTDSVIDFTYGLNLRASSKGKRPVVYNEELGVSSADSFWFARSIEVGSAKAEISLNLARIRNEFDARLEHYRLSSE